MSPAGRSQRAGTLTMWPSLRLAALESSMVIEANLAALRWDRRPNLHSAVGLDAGPAGRDAAGQIVVSEETSRP